MHAQGVVTRCSEALRSGRKGHRIGGVDEGEDRSDRNILVVNEVTLHREDAEGESSLGIP
jgi:hypothetical protein